MNTGLPLPKRAQQLIKQHLSSGDYAIDATVGNGHDTVFLAQQLAPSGQVFGFDIQQQAIEKTRSRLVEHNLEALVTLFQSSHARMAEHIPSNLHRHIKATMFNLGYLPGGDKSIITHSDTTLAALETSISLMAENGIITVLVYPGHAGGDTEAQEIHQWLSRQQSVTVKTYTSPVVTPHAPILHCLEKC